MRKSIIDQINDVLENKHTVTIEVLASAKGDKIIRYENVTFKDYSYPAFCSS
jgi:hypothetical protein